MFDRVLHKSLKTYKLPPSVSCKITPCKFTRVPGGAGISAGEQFNSFDGTRSIIS